MSFDEATAYQHINHPNNPYHDPDVRGLCPGCESVRASGLCEGCRQENSRRKNERREVA